MASCTASSEAVPCSFERGSSTKLFRRATMASCTTWSVLSLVGFQKRGSRNSRPQGNDGILHIDFDIPDTASSYLLLRQIILQLMKIVSAIRWYLIMESVISNRTGHKRSITWIGIVDTRPDSSLLPTFHAQHIDFPVHNATSFDDAIHGQSLVMALYTLS